jgi:hypothetical protein
MPPSTAPPVVFRDASEWNLASRALLYKYNRAIDALQRTVQPLVAEVKREASVTLFTGDTPTSFLFMLNDKVSVLQPRLRAPSL